MGILQRLNDAMGRKGKTVVTQETTGQLFVNPLCSNYENVYAQVRVLVDELKTIVPYGLSKNGKRLPITRTPELAALQYPNEQMGYMEFIDLMFSTWLTEKELNIHVWKDGHGKIKGYTVLPYGSRVINPTGSDYFQVYTKDRGVITIQSDEVMTLRYSRNPHNIDEGVSPASAVTVYAQIADVIAQYQKAWFENGATPASITFIAAKTRADFDAKVDTMQREYHGAKNKGKTLFFWRQFLDTGESANEIEVKPIQANNSTMAIKEIMSIVSEEINKSFGVSPFLMGNDSSAKYDNAELSDRNFTKRRVYPALLSFWSQFQHELDRILGGLGYSISFDLEIPELTDRLKVKAEISGYHLEQLATMINSGVTPKAAIRALELPDRWEKVAIDLYTEKQNKAEAQDKNSVISDTATLADNEMDGHSSVKKCNTHTVCTQCEHSHDALPRNYEPTFTEEEEGEEEIYGSLMELVEDAVAELAEDEDKKLKKEEQDRLRRLIIARLVLQANAGAKDGVAQVRAQVSGTTKTALNELLKSKGYEMSDEFVAKLESRVDELTVGLTDEAKAKAAEALRIAKESGHSKEQIAADLAEVLPRYRAETIARNETVYAFRAGHLEADKDIAERYNLQLKKTWKAHPGACEICSAMDGEAVGLTEAFPDSIEGKDGTTYAWEHTSWNDGGEIPSAHTNCRCYFNTEVIHG